MYGVKSWLCPLLSDLEHVEELLCAYEGLGSGLDVAREEWALFGMIQVLMEVRSQIK